MGLFKSAWLLLLFWVVSPPLCFRFHYCYGSELSVKFLKAPLATSRFSSAKFSFQAFEDGNRTCSSCRYRCKVEFFRLVNYIFLLDEKRVLSLKSTSCVNLFQVWLYCLFSFCVWPNTLFMCKKTKSFLMPKKFWKKSHMFNGKD